MRNPIKRFLVPLLVLALFGAACSADAGDRAEGPAVVVTTTVLGDIVGRVVGDAGSVEVLMPIGADPHDFSASSAQVAAVSSADLVVANGLGLEEGLEDVLEAAAGDGVVVLYAGELADPLPFDDDHDHDEDEADHDDEDEVDHDHDHGDYDPHVWMDPSRMVEVVGEVAEALGAIDAEGSWAENADAYIGELTGLDADIEASLAVIDHSDRKLVTNHLSFGYFADRYDFEVVGVVVPGGSTLAEPSSAELAALVETMESEGVDVVFAETTESATLAEALIEELGEDASVVELYTGSLGGDGSGAETYIGMMSTNAELIAAALG